MSARIRPLRGQCLVEILPENLLSPGGISIPETAKNKDGIGKLPPLKGRVLRLGPWPCKKNGLAPLPDFAPGDTVLLGQYSGVKLNRMGRRFRMVRVEDVIAKFSE